MKRNPENLPVVVSRTRSPQPADTHLPEKNPWSGAPVPVNGQRAWTLMERVVDTAAEVVEGKNFRANLRVQSDFLSDRHRESMEKIKAVQDMLVHKDMPQEIRNGMYQAALEIFRSRGKP
jgi:hypothetical protein